MTTEFNPVCELVPESAQYDRVVLNDINYDLKAVRLTLSFDSLHPDSRRPFQLVFENPQAVRAIDEGQVCEFWKDYHQKNGWLWRVLEGGWMDLETSRGKFWIRDVMQGKLREYMIANNTTVFVLTCFPPKFVPKNASL